MEWWKKLVGENAPLLTLEPPPVDPDLVNPPDDGDRDYGPDPIAEYSLEARARQIVRVDDLNSALAARSWLGLNECILYVRTPAGRVTFLQSSSAPEHAVSIIVGWPLRDGERELTERIFSAARNLSTWLADRPEGFAPLAPDQTIISARCDTARRIIEIRPKDVAILASPSAAYGRLDGKKVWRTLHAMGVAWGDMDQFQWPDPTAQTHYLFRAEVDDEDIGYALPQEIAAGRQHFSTVRFIFDIARTPHPAHVVSQMILAANAFARELDCQLRFMVDDVMADGPSALKGTVCQVTEGLAKCGVRAGSHSVCVLR